jgi:3-oxoacyl-[acyl-carrier protein] reductase
MSEPRTSAGAKALVFGASGVIGSQIAQGFARAGVATLGLGSRAAAEIGADLGFRYLQAGRSAPEALRAIEDHAPFDRVVWAHGVNANDCVYAFDRATMLAMFDANVLYICDTLHGLLSGSLIVPRTRFCIVSSIWQTIARQQKLSYSVTKAALQGLVASAAVDLAKDGHLVNAILPGVLDTTMTRSMLTPPQLERIEQATLFNRLPECADVVAAAMFLCADTNRSVTGQFLAVDLGFRNVRLV